MKIGRWNGIPERECLRECRTTDKTPHQATGLSPIAILFQHKQRLDFPRKNITEKDISRARDADQGKKMKYETKVNASKYQKKSHFNIRGDVLIRTKNRKISSKI